MLRFNSLCSLLSYITINRFEVAQVLLYNSGSGTTRAASVHRRNAYCYREFHFFLQELPNNDKSLLVEVD
jgi:hypothetical protein